MQIYNNQLSFNGIKSNQIRQDFINQKIGLKARRIPDSDNWVAEIVPVVNGKLRPVSDQIINVASKEPLGFIIGKSKMQAMFKTIRSLLNDKA